ncbi:MAG: hypothetical protein P4L53_23770 [Candidatus Obscuribacterales bacterium]|nr:hypothetical protein [Candidatus Obscuribacterales bacterium]
MIPYAKEIRQQLLTAAEEAFNEIVYADGKDLSEAVRRATLQANNDLPRGIERKDSIVAAIARTINQATFVAGCVEHLTPQAAFRRAMAQIAKQLSEDIERLTDPDRREQYEDCMGLIADDPFLIAVKLAATHVVGSAARNFTICDEEAMANFISAELDEGNAFMLSDLYSIRAAARECGKFDTADDATN